MGWDANFLVIGSIGLRMLWMYVQCMPGMDVRTSLASLRGQRDIQQTDDYVCLQLGAPPSSLPVP